MVVLVPPWPERRSNPIDPPQHAIRKKVMITALRLVLGDQISWRIASLEGLDRRRDVVLMVEADAETTYVRHHKKKIAFVLSAMRAFATRLERDGVRVRYITLEDPENTGTIRTEVARAAAILSPERIIATEPGEHRLAADLSSWQADLGLPVDIREDTRFLCSHERFRAWAHGRKSLRMEHFYRAMRAATGLLMEGDAPVGGRWNFDSDNRKRANPTLSIPLPRRFEPDTATKAVLTLVANRFGDHFGDLEPFWFAVTHTQAAESAAHFMREALPRFGDYQDAMLAGQPFLYHSVLSQYLNIGLLDALTLCRQAEAEYTAGRAPLNAVEGFVRQILGWREYVRGIYWREGPRYLSRNALGATRDLPALYWTGETEMACVAAAVAQTRQEAYAHHIQRLMVTGNFALLAGIDPHQLHEWYLAVYADAYEWVEAPNTIGMSQFADGGLLASKPYAASGSYINRMSDYCSHCAFDVKAKAGIKACPFNYLYWDFLARHEAVLRGIPRLGPMYQTLKKMSPTRRAEIRQDSQSFLEQLG